MTILCRGCGPGLQDGGHVVVAVHGAAGAEPWWRCSNGVARRAGGGPSEPEKLFEAYVQVAKHIVFAVLISFLSK